MNPKKIMIDGKAYNNVEEMPPDVRQKYEAALRVLGDTNGNHIPDIFESPNILADQDKNGVPDLIENLAAGQAAISSLKIIVDGKEYAGPDALPPEVRAKYEAAMSQLNVNKNGIPDFVEGMLQAAGQNQTETSSTPLGVAASPRPQPLPVSPTIAPDTSNGLMLVLAGVFLFLLCVLAGGAAWYFFLR
jgi:hypothetical protein